MKWDEAEHPRVKGGTPGGHGGEFLHVGGWIVRLTDQLRGRTPQRDLSKDRKVLDQAASHLVSNDMWGTSQGQGDKALEAIYEAQGFHAKPEVLSKQDMDQRIADGWIELWRGAGSREYAEDYRSGDRHYAGWGIHTNGTHGSLTINDAADYVTHNPGMKPESRRDVLRIAMRPDIRVARVHGPEWHQWQADVGDYTSQEFDSMPHMTHDDRRKIDARLRVLHSFGRWAALHGYDAVVIPGGYMSDRGPDSYVDWEPGQKKPRETDHYAILNRGATAVQEEVSGEHAPHPFDELLLSPTVQAASGIQLPDYMNGVKFVNVEDLIGKNKIYLLGRVEVYDDDTQAWQWLGASMVEYLQRPGAPNIVMVRKESTA